MTSLARRCDLILALIDACLEEDESARLNDTRGRAPEAPGRSDSALPGAATGA
jgi:hypothetical protein